MDHKLVKKYFIDLYNQALVMAMKEQDIMDERKSQFTAFNNYEPYKNHKEFNEIKPVKAEAHHNWKGGPPPHHKHKHHTHYHQHTNEHKHAHKHEHEQKHNHKHSAKHKHVHKHEHHHEHNHHHKHKDNHDHGHDHKHSHRHLHSHKNNAWRRSSENLQESQTIETTRNINDHLDRDLPSEDGKKFDEDIFKSDDSEGVFTDYHSLEYDAWEKV